MSTSLRSLLSDNYIPFGTQYYRAPSPYPYDWERDLKNITDLGFNMVKFWVQWRWNNPAEGKYYFDDIDRLMDIAQKNNLRVMLNTIFDVAPAWLYQKYPDAVMITLDGRKIGPQTQPHRQIGGLGICFNHKKAMEYFFTFLRETVKRYNNHPALEIWNIGSEPELTSSMAEIRLYAENPEKMGDMLCYCDSCRTNFEKWLKGKYKTIDALNVSWNRNYQSFTDIELPKTRNTFNDMIDWRMFFVYTLGQNVKRRFEVAKDENSSKHPLMCHHVFIQGFPVTSTASDPWNVGQYGDLHGFTQMDDPMMSDILRSCAKGKPIISAEMLMLFGYTLNLPKPIEMNDIKRYIFTGVAANQKGFIFWQYRPEVLGREAPTWGLTYLDGSITPWLRSFGEVNKVIQKNASFLHAAKPRKADVALLYNPENQIFAWVSSGNEKFATNSLLGTHEALYERNFIVDFIHPREFDSGILEDYKIVYIPFPYCLSETICRALEQWVKKGGALISESYFGGWNIEEGHHATVVPGYGFDKIFKVRQSVVAPADEKGIVEIKITKDIPYIKKGHAVEGSMVKETFFVEGAVVLATFATGEPAITMSTYGKGKAIMIGSYIGFNYHQTKHARNGDVIAGIVEMVSDSARPMVAGNTKVRVDVLTTNKDAMIIVRNLMSNNVETTMDLPLSGLQNAKEEFTGELLQLKKKKNSAAAKIKLRVGEVKVYRASMA